MHSWTVFIEADIMAYISLTQMYCYQQAKGKIHFEGSHNCLKLLVWHVMQVSGDTMSLNKGQDAS